MNLRAAARPDPAAQDRAEAAALEVMADSLVELARAAMSLSIAARALATALRKHGGNGCDGPRWCFVLATADFTLSWRAAQQTIADARDITKEGLPDD